MASSQQIHIDEQSPSSRRYKLWLERFPFLHINRKRKKPVICQ